MKFFDHLKSFVLLLVSYGLYQFVELVCHDMVIVW